MPFSFEIIIFYLLALDAIAANVMAWCTDGKWYRKNFRTFSRQLPMTRGWSTWYLILVAVIGYLLWRLGAWA